MIDLNKDKHYFFPLVKLEVSTSRPAAMLMNPGDSGAVRRGAHDVSVSPVIWYVSAFLHRKKENPTFQPPHVEVNLCSCQHFLQRLKPGDRAQKTRRRDTEGHKPNEDDAEQIFPQVDKSWHRHRCIWQIPRFCACLNVSQMVVNSEAWRGASLCVEAIGEEH